MLSHRNFLPCLLACAAASPAVARACTRIAIGAVGGDGIHALGRLVFEP